jgi:hypothetical protein
VQPGKQSIEFDEAFAGDGSVAEDHFAERYETLETSQIRQSARRLQEQFPAQLEYIEGMQGFGSTYYLNVKLGHSRA